MDIRRISILVPFAIATANATTTISPDHPSVRIFGRSIASSTGTIQWSWSGSGASITFSGTSCTVLLQAPGAIYGVFVDGKETVAKPAPSLRVLCTTLLQRGDPRLAASWIVPLK